MVGSNRNISFLLSIEKENSGSFGKDEKSATDDDVVDRHKVTLSNQEAGSNSSSKIDDL